MELLIVVIIVGILAAVAIPNFLRATDRSREAEPRGASSAILLAEAEYYQRVGIFSNAVTDLLVSSPTLTLWTGPTITSGVGGVTVSYDGAGASGHTHTGHFVTGFTTPVGDLRISAQGAS